MRGSVRKRRTTWTWYLDAPPDLMTGRRRQASKGGFRTKREAQEALKRVYEDAVSMDASRNGSFLVGDFNGDLSQDIAIVVKPAKNKLAAINDEVANWILGDALKDLEFDSRVKLQKSSSTPARIRIQEQDNLLLAIIHGFGPAGWRDPEARQTYLLRNAVGTDLRAQPFNLGL